MPPAESISCDKNFRVQCCVNPESQLTGKYQTDTLPMELYWSFVLHSNYVSKEIGDRSETWKSC
jgi:hypothetical protein